MDIISAKNFPLWMGIINCTPDSFSDGGNFLDPEKALQRAQELVQAGAQILDIGGVSTRPGSESVSFEEEKCRVFPVLRKLRAFYADNKNVLMSLDSYNPDVVALAAQENLIDIINDVRACREVGQDGKTTTAHIAARYDLYLILMHMQGTPLTMQQAPAYNNCIQEIAGFLKNQAAFAQSVGVQKEKIILDPGIGFGKLLEHNLQILSEEGMNILKELGYPLLIGLSRKRMVAELYKTDPGIENPRNRDKRSKELEFLAIKRGASIIRTHVMPKMLSMLPDSFV